MKKLLLLLFIISRCFAQTVPVANTIPNTVSYTLPQNATVSIGVYFNNSLIRTIESNVSELAGTHSVTWDGNDDNGVFQTIGQTYQIKERSNNNTYTWATIGNSSLATTGSSVWRGGSQPLDMVLTGSYARVATGFSELNVQQCKFLLSSPQAKIEYSQFPRLTGQASQVVCANSNFVFWGGSDYTGLVSYVFGENLPSETEATFTSGVAYQQLPQSRKYNSVLAKAGAPITGLAIQQAGQQYLFVSRASINQIQVLDITTGGNTVQTVSITNPSKLIIDQNGALWVAQGTTVTKYTINSNGSITAAGPQITGLASVVGLSAYLNELAISDAGNQQIVKFYNLTTLAQTHTIGQLGGYASTPVVSNDRFYFSDTQGTLLTFCRHDGTGGIWIGDPGNSRIQHFDGSGTFLESIAYVPEYKNYTTFKNGATYNLNICKNQNTAIFLHLMEYSNDYSQPIGSGGALVKNWGYNLPVGYENTGLVQGAYAYPNGHRYVILKPKTGTTEKIAELTSTGLRITSTSVPLFCTFDKNGDLITTTKTGSPVTLTYKKQHVTFDVSFNPIVGSATNIASIQAGYYDPLPLSTDLNVTANGRIVIFDPSLSIARDGSNNTYFHLAAFDSITQARVFHNRINTFKLYLGDLPSNGDYDIGNGVNYQGTGIGVAVNDIITCDRGEGWKGYELCILNHYNSDGLLQRQFGVIGKAVVNQLASYGYASNSLSCNVTTYAGDDYVLLNDESQHSAIHIWKIGNLASESVQTINIQLTNRIYVPFANVTDLLKNVPNGQVSVSGTPGFSQSKADVAGQFYSKTRINIYDFTKSADVQLYRNPSSGTDSWSMALNPVPNWTVTGVLDLTTNTFAVNTESGNPGVYLEIADNAGKAIARLYFSNSNRIQFNHVFRGPFLQSKVNSSKFVIKRTGASQINLSIDLWGSPVSVQANMYDVTADITKPTSLNFVVKGVLNSGIHIGLNEIKQL